MTTTTTIKTCPAALAYRSMADIGPAQTCGHPAVTERGFCRIHDPLLKPRRDAKGRIIATTKEKR